MSSSRSDRPRARSVRYRLLAIALVPMLLVLPVLLGIGIWSWMRALDELKISKVADDLTIAQQYLQKLTEGAGNSVVAVSESHAFHEALFSGDNAALSAVLRGAASRHGFDFLYLVDSGGQVIASDIASPEAKPRADWPIIAAAQSGQAEVGLDVFTAEELAAIAPALAERARIELVSTGAPSDGAIESRGLVLHSASGVTLPDGKRAALVAGMLLNNNLAFVDRINDLVFHGPGLLAGSLGTVTLSLDDIRISTNVHLFEERRAIGTRVSDDVRHAVLDEGRTWLESAFVVNDRFVSGYAPLLDTFGQRIDALCRLSRKPITEVKLGTAIWTLVALLIAAGITVPVFLVWAAGIFRPLERIDDTIARIEAGEPDARTRAGDPADEIGRVAKRLDELLDQVQDRERSLRQLNGQLSALSEQRRGPAREEQRARITIEHLVMSEKLATIGQITASIAHEVNNPVAIMQGNLELLREQLGPAAIDSSTELDLLDQQLRRMKEIIDRLLLFARPHEYAAGGPVSPGEIVTETLPFVRHVLQKGRVELRVEDLSDRTVAINRVELQQVLVNLMVNAVQAMPDGARWPSARSISTGPASRASLSRWPDTGTGMLLRFCASVRALLHHQETGGQWAGPVDQPDAGRASGWRADRAQHRARGLRLHGLASGGERGVAGCWATVGLLSDTVIHFEDSDTIIPNSPVARALHRYSISTRARKVGHHE